MGRIVREQDTTTKQIVLMEEFELNITHDIKTQAEKMVSE
jgi:hypothetical protein